MFFSSLRYPAQPFVIIIYNDAYLLVGLHRAGGGYFHLMIARFQGEKMDESALGCLLLLLGRGAEFHQGEHNEKAGEQNGKGQDGPDYVPALFHGDCLQAGRGVRIVERPADQADEGPGSWSGIAEGQGGLDERARIASAGFGERLWPAAAAI